MTHRVRLPRLAVLAGLLLGFALRAADLTGTPPGISGDEMFYFRDARAVLRSEHQVYFPTNTGHEPLFVYAEAVSVSLFGANSFALRFTAVASGMIGLATCYALARRLFSARAGLAALALFATLFWPVLITRIGLRVSTYPTFSLLSLYALWRALHDRSWRWTLAAGVLNGLTLYTYVAARVFPAIVVLWLLALLIVDRKLLRANLLRIGGALGLAALIALPLVVFAAQNPDVFNQRLNTMGGPYFEVQRGDFSGLIANIGHVLGMFTLRGDAEGALNADARPAFDPITGALFWLGAIVGLGRLRRPAYALLFIWLLVGLLPTVLAAGAPSFLRASGALFPILALPGIGLDWLADRLERLAPNLARRADFAPIALAGALALGGVTAATLFGPWRTSPGAVNGYESDLYRAARYLEDNPPPAEATVFVVAGYAHDHARTIFGLQSTHSQRVRWSTDMVWPAQAGEVWYFFSRESTPDDQARAWLGSPPTHREIDNTGQAVLEVYRLSTAPELPRPSAAMQATFDRLADLVGVSYAQPLARGESAEVALFWRVRPDASFDPADPPGFRLRLESHGLVWGEASGFLAFPPSQWQAGDVWVQRATLRIPPTMPPQSIQPELIVTSQQGTRAVFVDGDPIARPKAQLPAVEVLGRPLAASPPNAIAQFGDALALLSVGATSEASPGSPVFIGATWQALRDLDRDYALQIELREQDGRQVAGGFEVIWGDVYPTHRWRQGEQVAENSLIVVPPEAVAGVYQVRVRVVDAGGRPLGDGRWIEVGQLRVSGRARIFTRPPVDAAIDAEFGDVARLVGYRLNLDDARPGGSIALTLVWQAVQPSDLSLKVFAHLYNAEGGIPAQHDSVPANGAAPTTGWLPGEYIEDEHVIALDPALPPGEYRLGIGLYDAERLQRVSVRSNGSVSDALMLTRLRLP
jgi:4-amino-4-deoxy-L-arabinose transferase-like glycosyltransferase